MNWKLVTVLLIAALAIAATMLLRREEEEPSTIMVPVDFPTIQDAINNADPNDVILVASGLYYERIVVNKTVVLMGESRENTIIDGSGSGSVIRVTANNVKIMGFKLQNSGWKWGRAGVEVYNADNCVVENNHVYLTCHQIRLVESHGSRVVSNVVNAPRDPFPQSAYGIRLENCTDCLVGNNNVSDNIGGIHFEGATDCVASGNRVFQNSQGVRLYSPCMNNEIVGNTIVNNTNDGMLVRLPNNTTFVQNVFYHNNFINNSQSFIGDVDGCLWDNGQEGNFWSSYEGADADGDGIGDTPYVIDADNQDRYPLMHPWVLLSVRNVDTGLSYATIQEAIDAPQTLEGHMLKVDPETYSEHIALHKSLKIVGSGAATTIIDGGGFGAIIHITASNVSFSGFTVRNGGNNSIDAPKPGMGIFVDYCRNVTITENVVTACRYGIYLFHSASNTLMDNTISANYEDGIWLYYSGNNVLERNRMQDNKYNFGVFGQAFAEFNNTIDTSNNIDDKPIQYEIDISDRVIDSGTNAGTVYLINANNVTVRDLYLSANGNGVFLWNATGSTVENVTVSGSNYGIFLQESDGNIVRGNRCPDNWVGIFLESSDRNSVKGNTVTANEKAISLYGSDYNSLEGNTLTGSLYGVRFFASGFNEMWHNNVIENTHQADLVTAYGNTFDDGSDGNYWSNYDGRDGNEDGIGDSVYAVGEEQDRHPLMGRFYEFAVYSDPEELLVSIVCSSLITGFSFESDEHTVSFNVTNNPERLEFCRISIPTTFLSAPYTVRTFDSSWRNITSAMLPSTDEAWATFYFKYDDSTQSISIVGVNPHVSPPVTIYIAVILGAVTTSACFVAFFATMKRRRKTKPVK